MTTVGSFQEKRRLKKQEARSATGYLPIEPSSENILRPRT